MRALGEFFGNPDLELNAFAAGVIALGLCFGAYATEVFRGAILAIPKGHREAGVALGLSKWNTPDQAIGHYRRYTKKSLGRDFAARPAKARWRYLDAVGFSPRWATGCCRRRRCRPPASCGCGTG